MDKFQALREKITDKITVHRQYQRVFNTPDGQAVLMHILKHGHVFETTFVRGDQHETILREGERRMALSILKFLNQDHEKLAEQLRKGITDE
jgi:hypothetical protein